MSIIAEIKKELLLYSDKKRAEHSVRFFKAIPDGYGGDDKFLGIRVPNQRKVAKMFHEKCSLSDIEQLLNSSVHEHRLTALFLLIHQFEKSDNKNQQKIVDFYIDNLSRVNNWDLVDSSAYKILGPWLLNRDRTILFEFAKNKNLWIQRVSIIATLHFIRNRDFNTTLELAKILLHHEHDLLHKAVGWMLREVGNRDLECEINFLKDHYKTMPRTMLRYAIEKFPEKLRLAFLNGTYNS